MLKQTNQTHIWMWTINTGCSKSKQQIVTLLSQKNKKKMMKYDIAMGKNKRKNRLMHTSAYRGGIEKKHLPAQRRKSCE